MKYLFGKGYLYTESLRCNNDADAQGSLCIELLVMKQYLFSTVGETWNEIRLVVFFSFFTHLT